VVLPAWPTLQLLEAMASSTDKDREPAQDGRPGSRGSDTRLQQQRSVGDVIEPSSAWSAVDRAPHERGTGKSINNLADV